MEIKVLIILFLMTNNNKSYLYITTKMLHSEILDFFLRLVSSEFCVSKKQYLSYFTNLKKTLDFYRELKLLLLTPDENMRIIRDILIKNSL